MYFAGMRHPEIKIYGFVSKEVNKPLPSTPERYICWISTSVNGSAFLLLFPRPSCLSFFFFEKTHCLEWLNCTSDMMSYLYFLSFKYRLILNYFDLIDSGSYSDKSGFLMERKNLARIESNSAGGMNSTFLVFPNFPTIQLCRRLTSPADFRFVFGFFMSSTKWCVFSTDTIRKRLSLSSAKLSKSNILFESDSNTDSTG